MIWGDELVEEGGEVTSELGGGEMEVDDSWGNRGASSDDWIC